MPTFSPYFFGEKKDSSDICSDTAACSSAGLRGLQITAVRKITRTAMTAMNRIDNQQNP